MNRRTFLKFSAGATAAGISGGRRTVAAAPSPTADALHAEGFHRNRRFVTIPAGRIAYVEEGSGPAALFLHGFPLNSFQWRHAMERLSMHRRCIAPDFLGMGYTEVADGRPVSPDAQAGMLIALLDAMDIPDVDIVANDSGGAVAQLLLLRLPTRIRSLLLTNCDTEIQSPPAALLPVIELAKEGRYVDDWLGPWLADRRLARSPDGIGGMCYADPAHPTDEAIEAYFSPLLSTPRRTEFANAYASALEINPLAGIAPALRQSRVPTRIVWGMGDAIFAPENAEYLHRSLGNSRGVRRLATGKLFWPEEQPDILAEEARRLWNVTESY